jgi:hypothetical protein
MAENSQGEGLPVEDQPGAAAPPNSSFNDFQYEEWLTDEIRALLAAIKGEHAAKKRLTVIKLAFARANGTPVKRVFGRDDTCAEMIWYTKWSKKPAIKAAFEACCERALAWMDEQTAMTEASFRMMRRRSIAKLATRAPTALAKVMQDPDQRGSVRITAANALLTWADGQANGASSPRGVESEWWAAADKNE